MKVLMINVSCGTGSTGRICTDLAASLEELGHEVKIAYGRDRVSPQFEKYAVRIGTDFEVNIHAAYARVCDASGLGSKIGTRRFIKWVKEYNPDVIHLHNIHGYYLHVPTLFKYLKTCGKPIIWTLHDCWCFTGHTAFCDSANCDRWKDGCGSCPLLSQYPSSFIDRSKNNWQWKKECFTNVPNLSLITPSRWLAELVKQSFMRDYPVDVIHNGIDTSAFYPLKNDFKEYYGIEGKRVLLGVASIWNEMKGLDDFIKLSELVDDNTVIVMVGLTQEQIKHLPANIIGIERTSSVKELNFIYSSADVFLNLTYCDNYPTTNLEARACQIPIITYETGGSPESAGSSAVVVKRGNVEGVWKEAQALFHSEKSNSSEKVKDVKDTVNEYVEKYAGGYFEEKHKLQLSGKYVIIGVASVWDRRKGLDDFIKLHNMVPLDEYRIMLVGLSPDQIRCLPDSIRAIQRTESIDELRILYSIADVFFNPTIEDNYPTTNIEASCCGTPTITYCTGGSPESVIESQVVDRNDLNSVIQLIRKNDLEYLLRDDFNKQSMKKSYLKVYSDRT